MTNKKLKLIIASLVLVISTSLFTSCSLKKSSSNSNSKNKASLSDLIGKDEKTQTVTSTDGVCSITVPSSWQENLSVNPIANIVEGSPLQDQFIMTISESTADVTDSFTLDNFYNNIKENMLSSITNSEISDLGEVTINGLKGMQFELKGEVEGVKLGYLVTAVQSENHFHQVIAWTLQSTFDSKRDELNEIINSFKVLK